MKLRAFHLLPLTLLATALPAFAQPATTPANPVQRELIYCADQMSHEAVSYTHLDVYKRQGYRFRSAPKTLGCAAAPTASPKCSSTSSGR